MWSSRGSGGTWYETQKHRYQDNHNQADTILESLEPTVSAAAPHILFQFDKTDFVTGGRVSSEEQWERGT